jgi:hypothetical protein
MITETTITIHLPGLASIDTIRRALENCKKNEKDTISEIGIREINQPAGPKRFDMIFKIEEITNSF